MLRRLPENHKANAIRLLFGETKYDPLHELPHGDFLVRWVRFMACMICRQNILMSRIAPVPLRGKSQHGQPTLVLSVAKK